MISVMAMHPPPPRPCTARDTDTGSVFRVTGQSNSLRRFGGAATQRTSAGYEHVHALRRAGDGGADREGEDEEDEDGFPAERGHEASDEREDGGGGDGVRAPGPDEVRPMQVLDDGRQRGGDGSLQAFMTT